jgi:hypothetical protein
MARGVDVTAFGRSLVARSSSNEQESVPDQDLLGQESAMMCSDRIKATGARLLLGLLFVAGSVGRVAADHPTDWGGGGDGYEASVDRTEKHGGEASGSVKAITPKKDNFGTLVQAFKADKYRGKRLRMSAYVKAKDVEGWSGLWMRVDGQEKSPLAFDNMQERPIKGTKDWKQYEVVLDVPEDAFSITFGILLADGEGQVWVDDFKFEAVGKNVKTTGMKVEPMKREGELEKDLSDEPKNLDFEK